MNTKSTTLGTWQLRIGQWMSEVWGAEIADDKQERLRRFFEEAVEVCQAGEMPREMAHKIVDIVYDKPKGDIYTELGQCLFVLFTVSDAYRIVLAESLIECDRIAHTPERIEKLHKNQEIKKAKGL